MSEIVAANCERCDLTVYYPGFTVRPDEFLCKDCVRQTKEPRFKEAWENFAGWWEQHVEGSSSWESVGRESPGSDA